MSHTFKTEKKTFFFLLWASDNGTRQTLLGLCVGLLLFNWTLEPALLCVCYAWVCLVKTRTDMAAKCWSHVFTKAHCRSTCFRVAGLARSVLPKWGALVGSNSSSNSSSSSSSSSAPRLQETDRPSDQLLLAVANNVLPMHLIPIATDLNLTQRHLQIVQIKFPSQPEYHPFQVSIVVKQRR